jgi:uncharacterized membrane protein YvbJ
MKQCPFCIGQIPDAAVKCQHCGDWVDGRKSGGESELARTVNRLLKLKLAMMVVGLIAAVLLFFFLWLPHWNSMQRHFDNFPSFPSSSSSSSSSSK